MGVDSSDVQCSPGGYVSHFHCPPVVGFAYVLVHMVLDSIVPLYTWDLLILYALSTGCCCLFVSPVHLVLVSHGFPVGVDVSYVLCPVGVDLKPFHV